MSSFTPRLTRPANTDLRWINTAYGGYNQCILGSPSYGPGSVLSNCVGYAWGRWLEILNATTCNLSINQAEIWYLNTGDGYARGSTPKLGAVICYDEPGAGSGHVAIVEQINYTGGNISSIVLSESVYGGVTFRLQTVYPPNYNLYVGMNLQGFIYLPITFDELEIYLYPVLKRRKNIKIRM